MVPDTAGPRWAKTLGLLAAMRKAGARVPQVCLSTTSTSPKTKNRVARAVRRWSGVGSTRQELVDDAGAVGESATLRQTSGTRHPGGSAKP